MNQPHANREMPQTARVFVALALPAEVRDQIKTFREELRGVLRNPASFRWTNPAQVHLTLKFLGDIVLGDLPDVEKALGEAVRGVGPMELQARGLDFFPDRRRPRVCWIGVEGNLTRLRALHENVDRLMEVWVPREKKPFTPHLTLARVKWADQELSQALGSLPERMWCCQMGVWQCGEMDLMQSKLQPQGACHTRLAGFPLAGPI